jgi:TldD protein
VEGDRVLGGESAWAGRSWWKELRGKKVGSKLVTAVSDGRPIKKHRGFYGTFHYDDEGVPAQHVVHIEKGRLKNFLHSRQTAYITGAKPSGAMRANGAGVMPIIRMTNTYFEPDPKGPGTLEETIEDVKEGVLIGHQSIPSIDSRRYRWQINAYEGWEIKKGEPGRLLKNLALIGTTPDYFNSVYRVGGPKTWELHQVPNCGKGDPMQIMRVGNGGPLMVGIGRIVGGA